MSGHIFASDAFAGKVALISGGSSGIGLAVAGIIAGTGGNVLLMGRDKSRGSSAIASLIDANIQPDNIAFISGDVRSANDCEQAVNEAVSLWGKMDILINSAGVYKDGAFSAISEADINDLLAINVVGTMLLIRAGLSELTKNKGCIVNLASDAGISGNYACAAYAATKGAVVALTRSLALELAGQGIRVNAVAPADILTPMTERQLTATGSREIQLSEMASIYPLGRIGTPGEAASVTAFLASEASSFVTGSIYMVDGGLTA